jgi:hypothetical protein
MLVVGYGNVEEGITMKTVMCSRKKKYQPRMEFMNLYILHSFQIDKSLYILHSNFAAKHYFTQGFPNLSAFI